MIKESNAKKYCKDNISKIENYEKAILDKDQMWDCHHRLEMTLDGEFAHTYQDLIRLGMYYDRPYFELIFLLQNEHMRLHRKNPSDEYRKANSERGKLLTGSANPFYGRTHSDAARQAISAANKGRKMSAEYRTLQSRLKKGKPLSEHNKVAKAEAQRLIGIKYREYKSNGGNMDYNAFRKSIAKSRQ